MDALENRVRAFTEGVVIMACPVLLALALNKVNLSSEGSGGHARSSISPLAASCLLASFISFAFLSATSILRSRFQLVQGRLLEFLFRSSKLLIHSCAILQMVLAYMILLLITMDPKPWWIVSAAFGLVLLVCCVLSLLRSQEQDSKAYPGCDEKLEQSLDFSAAVASLLFLALEGLALEGQPSIDQGQGLRIRLPLVLTFVICVVATFFMVLGVVPPAIHGNEDPANLVQEREKMLEKRCQNLSLSFDASCFVLAIFFTAVVVMITWKLLKEAAVAVAAVPWVGIILVFVLGICDQGGNQSVDGVKPASLELTKVTFTGFLAVSISSVISDSSAAHSSCTHAFVFITAMAAVSGLIWRLMTHFTMRAAAVAAYAACLLTHLCVTAAVVPFVIMATQAMAGAKDNKTCQIPCGSNQSLQQESILVACFRNMTGDKISLTLSSVTC